MRCVSMLWDWNRAIAIHYLSVVAFFPVEHIFFLEQEFEWNREVNENYIPK